MERPLPVLGSNYSRECPPNALTGQPNNKLSTGEPFDLYVSLTRVCRGGVARRFQPPAAFLDAFLNHASRRSDARACRTTVLRDQAAIDDVLFKATSRPFALNRGFGENACGS